MARGGHSLGDAATGVSVYRFFSIYPLPVILPCLFLVDGSGL